MSPFCALWEATIRDGTISNDLHAIEAGAR